MKKILCLALSLLLIMSLYGCKSAGKEVNLLEKLNALMVTDEALGVKGKYSVLSDIKDGSVDKDIVGTWKTADGETTYIYNEDSTVKVNSTYGDAEAKFTCITSNDYKVICEETEMTSEDENGKVTESTVISYSTYNVENDALYMTIVEDTTDENMSSTQNALVVMYRADEDGSIDSSLAKNKITLEPFAGTWKSDKGEITIADNTLTVGEDVFNISINDKAQLVVEKDGTSNAYAVNVSIRKLYENEDKSEFTQTTAMGIYYTGADEKDKPNLLAVLDDFKAEYGWETYYYSGVFDLQK